MPISINRAGPAPNLEIRMEFKVENMVCGGCARGITRAVQAIDPAARVEADPATKRVVVESKASRDRIIEALREAGFPPAAA